MRFFINRVVLWRRNANDIQEYEFLPDMVNVISGNRQTGRTSFVEAIDYVFGARECGLPDKFNPAVRAVGVVFGTPGKWHLFAREVTESGKPSAACCFYSEDSGGGRLEVPVELEFDKRIEDAEVALNRIVCGNFKSAANKEGEEEPETLGFRDVLNLSMFDAATIANPLLLLRDLGNSKFRMRLQEYFPFILGIETRELVDKRNEKKLLHKQIEEKTKIRNNIARVSREWMEALRARIRRAQELRLYDRNLKLPESTNLEGLIQAGNTIIERNKGFVPPVLEKQSVDEHTDEMIRIQKQMGKLAELSQRLADEVSRLKDLDKEYKEIRDAAAKTEDRLEISKWVREYWDPRQGHFFAWSSEPSLEVAERNLKELEDALEKFQGSILNPKKQTRYDDVYKRELERRNEELDKVVADHRKLEQRQEELRKTHESVQGFLASQRGIYELLGEIKSGVDLAVKLSNSEISFDGLEDMKVREAELEREIAQIVANTRKAIAGCNRYISGKIKDRLLSLEASEDVKLADPVFDFGGMTLDLRTPDGHLRRFKNVGASTNYVCFHLALGCALQEQFAGRDDSPVANFAIFDCPAQGAASDPGADSRTNIRGIVNMLKESVAGDGITGSGWQPILVCESAERIFDDDAKAAIHTVAHFNAGSGIIPNQWLKADGE